MSSGLMLASFSTTVPATRNCFDANSSSHTCIAQALLYGIGAATVYFPVITLTPLHFDAHHGLVLGIVLSGTGFGGLANAPLIRALSLQRKYGGR